MTKYKTLTRKELCPIVQDYHRAFPEWHLLEGTLIARESGPVMQGIGFQCLSTGSYRPIVSIYYLCIPNRDGGFGVQFLKHPVQDIDPRTHERMRDRVVDAIHREIVPAVDGPLEPYRVLEMHEASRPIRSTDAHHLAALNAYFGRDDRALYWCDQFPALVEQHGIGWQDFDYGRKEFLDSLKEWIKAGQATTQLESVMQVERRKWGLG